MISVAASYMFLWCAVLILYCLQLSWPIKSVRQIIVWVIAVLMILNLVMQLFPAAGHATGPQSTHTRSR